MSYQEKVIDEYVILGNYRDFCGFEEICAVDTLDEAITAVEQFESVAPHYEYKYELRQVKKDVLALF